MRLADRADRSLGSAVWLASAAASRCCYPWILSVESRHNAEIDREKVAHRRENKIMIAHPLESSKLRYDPAISIPVSTSAFAFQELASTTLVKLYDKPPNKRQPTPSSQVGEACRKVV